MKAIAVKLGVFILERIFNYFVKKYEREVELKRQQAERELDNKQAIEELEKAKSEKEVVDVAKKLLTRK